MHNTRRKLNPAHIPLLIGSYRKSLVSSVVFIKKINVIKQNYNFQLHAKSLVFNKHLKQYKRWIRRRNLKIKKYITSICSVNLYIYKIYFKKICTYNLSTHKHYKKDNMWKHSKQNWGIKWLFFTRAGGTNCLSRKRQ